MPLLYHANPPSFKQHQPHQLRLLKTINSWGCRHLITVHRLCDKNNINNNNSRDNVFFTKGIKKRI